MTPAPDETVITPGDWLPGYEMLAVIGTGGFGTVFKARQFKLDRVVAVKIVHFDPATQPDLAARFENEAVTLGRLHHPNIVQVYDYGFHGGRMFIVMELLDGEDLGLRLKRVGKLDEAVAWAIARQAASALAHAAGQGVIHRDIKPPNLVLAPAPTGFGLRPGVPLVKVTDFGLARTKWAVSADDGRLTAPGTLIGTPMYMAPEQYRKAAEQDHRVDIYALGATVYHALAGRPPFAGDTIWNVMAQKLERTPPSWPDVSRASIELLEAMLAPDPADRIVAYEELIDRIDRLPALQNAVAPARSVKKSRQPSWRSAVTVAGSLAVAALGIHIGLPSASTVAAVNGPAPLQYLSGGNDALFDNATLKGWTAYGAGAAWQVGPDEDKATVLTGRGFVRRRFTPPEHFRLTIGLDVHDADAVDIHFAFAASFGRRLVLRVSKAAGAVLGVRDGDRAEFRPLAPAVPFPSDKWFKDRSPYPEVRFGRVGGLWSVWFNGIEAGRIADDGSINAGELRLNAEGGVARIDSVILEPLKLRK
jgi:serine/threonine protein kinase